MYFLLPDDTFVVVPSERMLPLYEAARNYHVSVYDPATRNWSDELEFISSFPGGGSVTGYEATANGATTTVERSFNVAGARRVNLYVARIDGTASMLWGPTARDALAEAGYVVDLDTNGALHRDAVTVGTIRMVG